MKRRAVPCLALLFCTSCGSSEQPAGGEPPPTTSTDTTWTQAVSPVVLTEDFTVPQGAKLTIEAGVTVRLARETSLTIDGQLVARGTETEPILFTKNDDSDTSAYWQSVVFTDSAADAEYEQLDEYVSGSVVQWCTFEHARRAIRVTDSAPLIDQCTFRNNATAGSIEPFGGAAIFVEEGATPRIQKSTFTENVANTFNWGGAIYVNASDPIIQDNVFTSNVAAYGGAIATDRMAAPIVGNRFEDNLTYSKGGAFSIVSTAAALLNNEVVGNHADADGGGIHVCVDCYPHATPFVIDNKITNNQSDNSDPEKGAAGFGAAYVRAMVNNDIHGNLRGTTPSDFGWYHALAEGEPTWITSPNIAGNWWGTTDTTEIGATIFDGNDDSSYGVVTFEPVLTAPITAAQRRVTITTRKLRYTDENDTMPVFLTIYNPSAAKQVKLVLLLQYGEGAPLLYQGALDFPDVAAERGSYSLAMPENAVFFTTLLEPDYGNAAQFDYGYWHAALFDATSGDRLGEACSIRFDLKEQPGTGAVQVPDVGVTITGEQLSVGATYSAVTASLGAPSQSFEGAAGGRLIEYAQHQLSILLSGNGDQATVLGLYGSPGFSGQTDQGISIGSDEAAVETAYGTAKTDPFLGTWWYGEKGAAFEFAEGKVTRIHLF